MIAKNMTKSNDIQQNNAETKILSKVFCCKHGTTYFYELISNSFNIFMHKCGCCDNFKVWEKEITKNNNIIDHNHKDGSFACQRGQ